MLLQRQNQFRDRHRTGGSFGSYGGYPGTVAESQARPLLIGDTLRSRPPFDSWRQAGLRRYNDPVSSLSLSRRRSSPVFDTLDPLSQNRLIEARAKEQLERAIAFQARRRYHGLSHYDGLPCLGPACEVCRLIGQQYNLDRGHPGERNYDCNCNSKLSSSKSDSRGKKGYDFKTKDITVRGKSYCVRKSFLADSSKFEADLIKFMDKKKEDQLPDRVVQMLIDFINEETCSYQSVLDIVLMNVLASSLGAKSAIEYSLRELKKVECEFRLGGDELTQICVAVMLSSKVDSGLEQWLKKFLQSDRREEQLSRSYHYMVLLQTHPELEIKLLELLGLREKAEDDALPIL